MPKKPDALVEILYTLRAQDGSFFEERVYAAQVPRVGELVAAGFNASYEVVDVLWHIDSGNTGGHRVGIHAFEKDWHEHFAAISDERSGRALRPDDARHLVALMRLIRWDEDEDGDSAIPKQLNQALDQERWIMLQNALIDWDIIRNDGFSSQSDAVFRLAVAYTIPVFEGASAEIDQALGALLSTSTYPMCESPGAQEGFGRRWREDLCATAWRLVLAHEQRDQS